MGYPEYASRVPQLVQSLRERGLLVDQFNKELSGEAYLTWACGIAYNTAKKYVRDEFGPEEQCDWNVLWKIYRGLRAQGITMLEGRKERALEFIGDVAVIKEKDE